MVAFCAGDADQPVDEGHTTRRHGASNGAASFLPVPGGVRRPVFAAGFPPSLRGYACLVFRRHDPTIGVALSAPPKPSRFEAVLWNGLGLRAGFGWPIRARGGS